MASVLIQKKKQGQDLALPRTTDKRKNAHPEDDTPSGKKYFKREES